MKGRQRFQKIFEQGKIGGLSIKNRIVMAPMGTHFAENGKISSRIIAYFAERAKGGVGLIETEAATVNTRLCGMRPLLRMDSDEFISGHSELIKVVHAYGSKIAMQLCHPGRQIRPELNGGQAPVAPSAVPIVVSVRMTGQAFWSPRELTLEEIYELVESFGAAARRARFAGYDAVEIHGAHGYLPHQFMSPHTNRRIDHYGGTPENRIRFSIEIIKSIKQKAGTDFPVIFRITAEETMDSPGYTLEDAKFFARQIESSGADCLHVTMGTSEDSEGINRNECPMSFAQGWRLPYIEAIKKVVSIPVIGVGAFREPEFVENALEQGKADFIALGRQLLADPYWVKKAASGEVPLIRKCLSCNYCNSSMFSITSDTILYSPLQCAINTDLGRELDYAEIRPSLVKKKVMVIGSGPSGMEAARLASQRGHKVAIYEKGVSLGDGQLGLAAIPPHKQKMKWLRDYLTAEVNKADIEVHLNTKVTAGIVMKAKPDVVIIATGAKPFIPDIPGVNNKNVVTAYDVLSGKAKIEGQKVAVLGQFSTGAETAEFLAEKGNKVTIVARSPIDDLARGVEHGNRTDLIVRVRKNKNITIINGQDTREIKEDGISIMDRNYKETFIKVDKVVLAQGAVPVNELSEQLLDKVAEVYTIGDAAGVRDIASAIYEGSLIARSI